MKMIIAIIRNADSDQVTHQLTSGEYKVTRISSTGGILKRGVTTLLVGVEDHRVDAVLQIMKQACSPSPEGEKRITIFVVPVEKFNQV